jgi:hypothetical protein
MNAQQERDVAQGLWVVRAIQLATELGIVGHVRYLNVPLRKEIWFVVERGNYEYRGHPHVVRYQYLNGTLRCDCAADSTGNNCCGHKGSVFIYCLVNSIQLTLALY